MRHSVFVSMFFASVLLAACGGPEVDVELDEQDEEEFADPAAYLNVAGAWDFASGTLLEVDPDGSVRGEPYDLHFNAAALDCVMEIDSEIGTQRFVVRASHGAEEAGFWLIPEGLLEVGAYEQNLQGNATARIEGALVVSRPEGLRRMELRSLARESAYRWFNLDLLEEDRAEGSVVLEDLCDASESTPICHGTMAATFACDPRVIFLPTKEGDTATAEEG